MPGTCASMPYLQVPLVFDGMSSCGSEWPILVYWSGVFSVIALSSSGDQALFALPLCTICAKVTLFFDLA